MSESCNAKVPHSTGYIKRMNQRDNLELRSTMFGDVVFKIHLNKTSVKFRAEAELSC